MRVYTFIALLLLTTTSSASAQDEDRRFEDPVTEAGQNARGLYLGARFVESHGVESVINAVRRARMNAVVLDLKDAEGRVHHDTAIPDLLEMRTGALGNTRELLERFDRLPYANKVCFTAAAHPDLATCVPIPEFAGEPCVGDLYERFDLCEEAFDFGRWLRDGAATPATSRP